MIVEFLVNAIFIVVKIVLNILPTFLWEANWFVDFIAMIVKASQFFPMDVFVVVIANIVFWIGVSFNWSVAMWVLKKLPFVK